MKKTQFLLRKLFLLGVALTFLTKSKAQNSISGNVKDENGNNLEMVSIQLEGLLKTCLSNSQGDFKISNLKKGKYVVRAYLLGYQDFKDSIILAEDYSVNIQLKQRDVLMDEILVESTRANDKSAMAFSNISKKELETVNLGQDLPILLNGQTSVVTTSDAGAGIGYTGLRIRGSDGTRINITVNGVPINDAESQNVFWVNMPDLVSSTNSIQIQRGVGTSTNGAGAFGASVNMQTQTLNEKAYAELNNSFGSFSTLKNTFLLGTGLINRHWSFDGRISSITSNGYVQRANSKLFGYYLAGAYYGKKTVVKAITFSGNEKTYQAWYGIHKDSLKKDRTQNSAGIIYNSDGTISYYSNETDNYKQDNYQLHLIQRVNDKVTFTTALHYTKGKGYYEQYKQNQSFYDYGIQPILNADSTLIESTDLIRRLWLDNDFSGIIYSLNYKPNPRFSLTFGGGSNYYVGFHFGEILWARNASSTEIGNEFYRDKAIKLDHNVYLKNNFQLTANLNAFIDLQYRSIDYSFRGPDNNFIEINQKATYNFFNPKAGITAQLNDNHQMYASFAVANKEPNRDDFVQSTPSSRPKQETLYDVEMGYRTTLNNFGMLINLYNMEYVNQLVLTGEINNVGAYNRSNVKNSYRRGLEIEANLNVNSRIGIGINGTFSQNHIKNYSQYIDDYDNGTQLKLDYKLTHIAFSPSLIAGASLSFKPYKNIEVLLLNKYIGKQYLDNTTEVVKKEQPFLAETKIDPYFVSDLVANFNLPLRKINSMKINFKLNNIFNTLYNANGYTYSYITGARTITEAFYYPQAGINFLAGISLKF